MNDVIDHATASSAREKIILGSRRNSAGLVCKAAAFSVCF